MGIKRFAFLSDQDVFTVFALDEDVIQHQPIIAGLRSKPTIVEVDDGDIRQIGLGWKYFENEFYAPAASAIEDDYEVE